MIRKLSFTRRRDWTSVLVDGEDRTVESFDEANAQLMARLLQGWIPQELGLERIQYETVGKPIWKARDGSAVFAARSLTRVIVELPGANRPEVDFDDCERLYFDGPVDPGHGVAVFGLDEGSPIVLAEISFSLSRVFWHLTFGGADGEVWEFTRAQYDAAIRDLLTLLGEEPILISPQEWAAPTPTRVVPA